MPSSPSSIISVRLFTSATKTCSAAISRAAVDSARVSTATSISLPLSLAVSVFPHSLLPCSRSSSANKPLLCSSRLLVHPQPHPFANQLPGVRPFPFRSRGGQSEDGKSYSLLVWTGNLHSTGQNGASLASHSGCGSFFDRYIPVHVLV